MKIEGFFNITDYSLTHNILLLRTTTVKNDEIVNTDLLFSSTFYLEIPTYFNDLLIENGGESDCQYISKRCDAEFVDSLEPKDVFVLKTNEQRYFVGARKLEIITNSLRPGETSIGVKKPKSDVD